ncbi:MAG TPA: MFS transporter, partial [Pseudomonadales bacterium]|nr:MFS transporter [Pseudomonadales bacterium]
MALWALASKFAAAFGALVALNLLDLMGFVPREHGASGKPALLFLYVVLPIICWLIAAAIIWRYPITESRHARIRARVERRLNQNGAATPRSVP